ncbi:hypothetical protein MBLNU230_g6117t2 [Neophaeotheca triangularis]
MPARSTAKPPGPNYAPNPSRPPNPFSPTTEPDWVNVEKPSTTSRQNSTTSLTPQPNPRTRTLAAPPSQRPQSHTFDGNGSRDHPPPQPPRPHNTTTPLIPSSTSEPPNHHHNLKQTLRKPAPPPKPKPSNLRDGTAPAPAPARTATPPLVPEPRRTGAVANAAPPRKPIAVTTGLGGLANSGAQGQGGNSGGGGGNAPELPRRRPEPGRGLMDEDDEEEVRGLGAWEVLRPG